MSNSRDRDEIEREVKKMRSQRPQDAYNSAQKESMNRVGRTAGAGYDDDIYGGADDGFDTSIAVTSDEVNRDAAAETARFTRSITAPKEFLEEAAAAGVHEEDPFANFRRKRIDDKQDDYQKQRALTLSPERADPFAAEDPNSKARTYREVLEEVQVDKEHDRVIREAKIKVQEEQRRELARRQAVSNKHADEEVPVKKARKSQWDDEPEEASRSATAPLGSSSVRVRDDDGDGQKQVDVSATPQVYAGETPLVNVGGKQIEMTPELATKVRWEREVDTKNTPWTLEDLDALLPSDGFQIVQPPAGYQVMATPSRRDMAPQQQSMGFRLQSEDEMNSTQSANLANYDIQGLQETNLGDLPLLKPEDVEHFGVLLKQKEEKEMDRDERLKREILTLLLQIKNGDPLDRKRALKMITTDARRYGAKALFDCILPIVMSPSLEDQERHLMVKVIDRVMFKLDDLVRPYVHKILVVIEPLLIDEDYYARVEGREIISNLAKAAGLATMISTMRPDIDSPDEDVRNTTARAFAVVAAALGIPALLPFLKAVCLSKKSWQARHTGIKIVQQIAVLIGCAVLPHLGNLVDIIKHGLTDEQSKVRTITALSLAHLAEAASPYGIEAFDPVLKPLWKGIRQHHGKQLAAFLKAIGFIIPLMDPEYASYYTREVMIILVKEFSNPSEEMKRIVLRVVKQCVSCEGVDAQYVREEVVPEYFKQFWQRRLAIDKLTYFQVVDTTVELANKIGGAEVISKIVSDLRDESEPYRRMILDAISKIVKNLGVADIDVRLEERLVDGMISAFQEQTQKEGDAVLAAFGNVFNALGLRAKQYLPQLAGTIKWRLNNKSTIVRQHAADLISRVANVMKRCDEEVLMGHLGVVLYEYLGEEYPDVLGSILGALKSIVNVIGMHNMTPPIKDLLPRLTPILKNRHEKVQENVIDLVGRIADRGAEFVSAQEWMRICFELLDMLKAHKKAIRRAAVNTFGYIAKAIGPHDVLATLLNNLKVQERQNRVCTTVAIAIVAETCGPFTILPALMNEYRVPDSNVQNGVLKALSFMFEYIGEMAKDYIYSVVPLLEDALSMFFLNVFHNLVDRDIIHRQTACFAVQHLTMGVHGLGCEDAAQHLLNYVFPNLFEYSPHVIMAVFGAIEGLRMCLGPGVIMNHLIQGLFHPARKLRTAYWKAYNNMYMAQSDALVPFMPNIPNADPNDRLSDAFRRHLFTLATTDPAKAEEWQKKYVDECGARHYVRDEMLITL